MSRIHDISVPLHPNLPRWPGSGGFRSRLRQDLAEGDEATVTEIRLDVHVGTHVDAPAHFLHGAPTTDLIDLETLTGPCRLLDLQGVDVIGPEELERASGEGGPGERVLLKTDNSGLWGRDGLGFEPSFVGVSVEGARWIVDHSVRLVGIDYLSVEPFSGDGTTHRVLLDGGIVILEGLDLSSVRPATYELLCLPLALVGCEGAPARAVLREFAEVET